MFLQLRYGLEYVALRGLLAVLDRRTLPEATRMVCRLADMAFTCSPSRRRIARDNILRAGLAATAEEAQQMARESFRHFATLIMESLRTESVFTEDNWRDKVELDISDELMALLTAPGKGIILVSAHVGNWEVAAQLLSYLKPVTGITSNMNNPYTNRIMQERKPRNRFKLTPKRDANAGRFLEVLKNGEVLALLADQHARKAGMMIPFFGVPASTHTSPAMLHLVSRCPLVFGACIRTGPMQYRLQAVGPITHQPSGDRKADIRAVLERLTHETEKVVRENPTQYLWAHRRWREKKGVPG